MKVINREKCLKEVERVLVKDSPEYKTTMNCIGAANGFVIEDGLVKLLMGLNVYTVLYKTLVDIVNTVMEEQTVTEIPLFDTSYIFEVNTKGKFMLDIAE